MRRPEVTLENHPAVYEYYDKKKSNRLVLRSVHLASRLIFSPSIHFDDGAEAAIGRNQDNNVRSLIGCNHIYFRDQFPVAAAIQKEPVLRPWRGNIYAMAKMPYFQGSKLKRITLDSMGAIPVMRKQDVADNERDPRAAASEALLAVCVGKVIRGGNLFAFPEGTRNGNPDKLARVKDGFGRIACKAAAASIPVALQPMGMWYGYAGQEHKQAPHLFIGKPINGPFESPEAATDEFSDSLTHCLTMAQQLHRKSQLLLL